MENKISYLFKNLCCSKCKSDFDENSVQILREEDAIYVVKLSCAHCGKDFGIAFLGVSDINETNFDPKKTPLKMIEDLPPISKDDVLDAHRFIKNLDEHWSKYLP